MRPARASPTARLIATVLLPTPPLPAPTAITCLTFGSGLLAPAPGASGADPPPASSIEKVTSGVSPSASIPTFAALRIASLKPAARRGSFISTTARPSFTSTRCTMFKATTSRFSSGSSMVCSTASTSSFVAVMAGS